ncbi:hypothetical protein B4U79_18598 [Dinothrombium tinctorium]|uniref:Serpin domain-containing protein n=1 Tax=Dinothrombium tinctorium TaxID=1965070 RepID=A0A443QDN0_9ACAR|nr:hypothetical protein B4U79_18598 [Dinothrombium tinctorium]
MDFIDRLDEIRNDLQEWVKRETNGMIDHFNVKDINFATLYMFLNVVYFRGNWRIPFDKDFTTIDSFYNYGDKSKETKVFMMKNDDIGIKIGYFEIENEKFEVIIVPYQDDYSFFIVKSVKVEGDLSKVWRNFKRIDECDLKNKFKFERRNLYMPKFSLSKEIDMRKLYSDLGINYSSSNLGTRLNSANKNVKFDIISGNTKHLAVIDVDEYGTEAAALSYDCVDGIVNDIKVNSPFIFYVKNSTNNTVIFSGQINKF